MTYRNYRNSLHKLMLSYLHFMKCADTDEQLLALNSEVNLLRIKIDWLDKKTASEMQEVVRFDTITYKSESFQDKFIPCGANEVFAGQADNPFFDPSKRSIYKGINYEQRLDKWRAELKYKGKTLLDEIYPTEDNAVAARDAAILKYHLKNPLHELKK